MADELTEQEVAISFAERYFADVEEGRLHPLEHYLALYPEHAVVIQREFDLLSERHTDQTTFHVPTDASGGVPSTRPSGPMTQGGTSFDLGRYRVSRELGHGGQATVYLAKDTQLGRDVALKVLRGAGSHLASMLERFRREAMVTARLRHPGICSILESGIQDGVAWIAMQYVEGETLAQRIRETRERTHPDAAHSTVVDLELPSPPDEARPGADPSPTPSGPTTRADMFAVLRVVELAARALHVAHEAGIIHRDIKPGNIIISKEGEPVLLDFGLAREMESDLPSLTQTGEFFGTPAYMSPEQLLAYRISLDRRTDVWSLGVTLYECLTLRRPFEAPTRDGLYQAIQSKDPPDPRGLNPAIPPDLRVVIETALDKDRDRRYQTALDLAEELRRVRQYEPIVARPASSWTRLKRWAQRSPALAGSLSAGFLFLTAGLVVTLLLLAERDVALEAKTVALNRYDQISDVALVEELRGRVATLWPRRPWVADRMRAWIEEARSVAARLPIHEAALDALRRQALPYAAQQRQQDRSRSGEAFPELAEEIARKKGEVVALKVILAAQREACAKLSGDSAPVERKRERLFGSIETREEQLAEARARIEELERDPRLFERLTWDFPSLPDRWRHRLLTQLVRDVRSFDALIEDVAGRLEFALSIRRLSVEDEQAAWDRCLREVASSPHYSEDLALRAFSPQVGLVPLGVDRDSGLWEFWHVDSGERPEWSGADWAADPVADPRGTVRIDESSGIVLVLVHGGSFLMGATQEGDDPSYDPDARPDEAPVEEVDLAPFFISKYEMTAAQWERLHGSVPNQYPVGSTDHVGGRVTPLHPVTNLSWHQCSEAMKRLGLDLPAEAQWEYAGRAGTETPFWCGDSIASIEEARAGNVSDRTASRVSPAWEATREIDDGHAIHAPVGAFAPNGFGLHDVIGNVWEWCRDRYALYIFEPAPGDGLRDQPGSGQYVARGGSYGQQATFARSALRQFNAPTVEASVFGCRPAMNIRTE